MLPAAADQAGPPSRQAESTAPDAGLEAPETVPIRPLAFRELLDLPFAVIQADIRTLAACAIAGLLVAEGLVVVINVADSALTDGTAAASAVSAIASTLLMAWLLRLFLRGMTVSIGLARIGGRAMSWRAALAQCHRRFGALLADQLVYTVFGIAIPAVGTVVLVIGLLGATPLLGWLRARRLTVAPVLFAESVPYRDAVGRAKILAVGAEWRLAWLWLALRALLLMLVVPLVGAVLFVANFSGTHRWAVVVLATTGALLIAAFAAVMDAAASVIGYVDRRCRREGWDVRIPVPTNRIARAAR
ncbi:hypothetical protein [Nocardia alni]|uniref:hypothetical protein n=1 Tax=Nocardia alni TaxID=2815723 RepID=UPI0020B3A709|nr:hypothetical protein [Nocardia alni]